MIRAGSLVPPKSRGARFLRDSARPKDPRGCLVAVFRPPMTTNVAIRRLLNRRQAAEVLGLSVRSIDRLRERGRLPGIQIVPGGRVLYRPDDVEALLEPENREPHPARSDELEWS